jgi:hypothetical protein
VLIAASTLPSSAEDASKGMRNQQMLDEGRPTLVVAFPGGRGTADMMRRARVAGIEVIEISKVARQASPAGLASP